MTYSYTFTLVCPSPTRQYCIFRGVIKLPSVGKIGRLYTMEYFENISEVSWKLDFQDSALFHSMEVV